MVYGATARTFCFICYLRGYRWTFLSRYSGSWAAMAASTWTSGTEMWVRRQVGPRLWELEPLA